MKLLFTQASNHRFQKKTIPTPQPVLVSNIFRETIKNTDSSLPISSQLNIINKEAQPKLNTYYEPVTDLVTDLNNIKYKNQPIIHPLKTGMIGRIAANISCKSCGR